MIREDREHEERIEQLRAGYAQQLAGLNAVMQGVLLWGAMYVVMVFIAGKHVSQMLAAVTAGTAYLGYFAQCPATALPREMQGLLVGLSIAFGLAAGFALIVGF